MNFECQADALLSLSEFAKEDQISHSTSPHSILIEGPSGCGKTYLASRYAKLLNCLDFVLVNPNVKEIRESIDTCYNTSTRLVLCIENLDSGAYAASYTLLKFLEEPSSNVYIVVTCRNKLNVPATICSRCVSISVPAPSHRDICEYAEIQDFNKFHRLKDSPIWKAVRTLKNVDTVLGLDDSKLNYLYSIRFPFTDCVSNVIWKLGHYEDNSTIDVSILLNYLISISPDRFTTRQLIECEKTISSGRIAPHAALAKFVLECKYGGS